MLTSVLVLCYQQVCKIWREHLPGTDRTLRHRLFLNYPRADNDEGSNDDGSRIHPHFIIPVRTVAEIVPEPEPLPFLALRTKVMPEIYSHDFGLPQDSTHPIFRYLEAHMDLIDKSLCENERGRTIPWLEFKTLNELEMTTRKFEKNVTIGGFSMEGHAVMCLASSIG